MLSGDEVLLDDCVRTTLRSIVTEGRSVSRPGPKSEGSAG